MRLKPPQNHQTVPLSLGLANLLYPKNTQTSSYYAAFNASLFYRALTSQTFFHPSLSSPIVTLGASFGCFVKVGRVPSTANAEWMDRIRTNVFLIALVT